MTTRTMMTKGPGTRRVTGRNTRNSRPASKLDEEELENLLLQALETEIGGIQVYETALRCAEDDDLVEEWEKYLEQTREHERILLEVIDRFDWDSDRQTAERDVVRRLGRALVEAMEDAIRYGTRRGAQLVAAECVTLAETKDHLNWELLGECAKALEGKRRDILRGAFEEVEEQEDEHLYHTMGWTRELWLDNLGLPAVLPPPEERKHVKSAIGAARAKKARGPQAKRSTAATREKRKSGGKTRIVTKRRGQSTPKGATNGTVTIEPMGNH